MRGPCPRAWLVKAGLLLLGQPRYNQAVRPGRRSPPRMCPSGAFSWMCLRRWATTTTWRRAMRRWRGCRPIPVARVPVNDTSILFRWVDRLEGVRADPDVRLTDALGLAAHGEPAVGPETVVQGQQGRPVHPGLPASHQPRLRLMGHLHAHFQAICAGGRHARVRALRNFRLDQGPTTAFENDRIYEMLRDMSILFVSAGANGTFRASAKSAGWSAPVCGLTSRGSGAA